MKEEFLMATIMRDMGFLIISLVLYDYFLYKGIIYFHEAVALFLIVVLYILVIVKMDRIDERTNKLLRKPLCD